MVRDFSQTATSEFRIAFGERGKPVVDKAPEDVLNRILWRSQKGSQAPYPEWAAAIVGELELTGFDAALIAASEGVPRERLLRPRGTLASWPTPCGGPLTTCPT